MTAALHEGLCRQLEEMSPRGAPGHDVPGGDGALPRRSISRSTGRRRELAAGNALEVPGLARDGRMECSSR